MLTALVLLSVRVSGLDSSPASVGDGMAGDAIGATGPSSTTTTRSFLTVRRFMDTAGTKDSTTLERRADMKGSTTLVASGDMRVLTASKQGAEMKRRAVETSVATNFTAAPLSVALRRRMPKPASIPVLLVGTPKGAPPAATRIVASRA